MNENVEFVTMSDREKYLFDLQGFLIVREFPHAGRNSRF